MRTLAQGDQIAIRLPGANKGSGAQTFSYDYDRYGNRWHQNAPQGGPAPQLAFPAASNRIDGYSYDAAGNLLNDGTHAYFYDAESRIIQVDGTLGTCSGATACYYYDADGKRVRKTVAGVSKDYLFDLSGNQVAEISSSSTLLRGEVYAGGRHLATYAGGTTYFIHTDWLGTERMRSNVSGAVSETCVSLPFGDGQSCTGGDPSPMHFTGKERDGESGLDNFEARYDSSSLGRFMSPDEFAGGPVDASSGATDPPDSLPYANIFNPQSLNKYVYVDNNPLRYIDPNGHELEVAAELQEWVTETRAQSPSFDAELAAHEGPNNPNLAINTGGTPNDPSGSPSIGNTSATIGGGPVVTCSPDCVPTDRPYTYGGATVTVNDSVNGDKSKTQDVLEHEVGHVKDARTNTNQYHKDSQNTQQSKGKTAHDKRPEEQRANKYKDNVNRERKQWKKQHCHGLFHKCS